MPMGTIPFTAFTASARGVGGLTIAQQASALNRPGMLNIQSGNITADTAAGFTLAELECGWDSAETSPGVFSSSYLSGRASVAASLKAAGYQVAVSAGIFYPPSWVSGLANWQYLDQGSNGSGTPNFTFSTAVRSAAAAYISQLTAAMTAAGVVPDYYRIGISPSGEMHLQDSLPISTGTGSWWAFDAAAQAAGGAGLPPGIGANPLIGWVPGNSTYSGGSVTSAMATTWWQWYMNAVNQTHLWEIAAHQAGGWNGCVMLCAPGRGLSPAILNSRIANLLGPSTLGGTSGDLTANIAADWPSMLDAVANPANMVLDISSVGNNDDSSGGNDVTQPGDQALTLAQADPAVTGWSGVRWLAYLAGQNGKIPCCGESVGDSGASVADGGRMWALASQVAGVMDQAKGCGLYALMWANDSSMNLDSPYTNPVGDAPYATRANVIAGFNAAY